MRIGFVGSRSGTAAGGGGGRRILLPLAVKFFDFGPEARAITGSAKDAL
jgi:hypothetical protein